MRFLIDTNIILELILQREQVETVKTLITCLRGQKCDMYMTEGGFYGMLYTIDNYLRKIMEMKKPERTNTLRSIMVQILGMFKVAGHDRQSLLQGISDTAFTDLEDSCQYQAALKMGCDYLLTFNIKDYVLEKESSVQVLSPQQYLEHSYNKME